MLDFLSKNTKMCLLLVMLTLPAEVLAQQDTENKNLDYNSSAATVKEDDLSNTTGYNQGPATRNAKKQGYTLDDEKKPDDYVSAEIKAMKFSQDYALKFNYDYSIDEAMRDATVYQRSRPDYQPLNVRVGSFLFAPQISVAEIYNDNIFSTTSNEQEDFITRVKPVLLLKSDWSRHALNVGLSYDAGIYQEFSDENFLDATYSVNGQLDVSQGTYLAAGVLVQRKHEDRSSVDEVNGLEPTEYTISTVDLEFYRKVSRVLLKMALEARQFDYSGTPAANNVVIDNGDRDRYEYRASTRVAYEFKPGYQAFMDVAYDVRQYVRDAVSDLRDSQGYRASVGTSVDISAQTKGEIYAGYLEQNYDSDLLEDITGVNYGANLLWKITRLTSVMFNANRTVSETTIAGSSGYVTSLADITVEHELRRNILLNSGFTFALNEYEGVNRTDNIYSASFGGKYLLNRNISINFDYNFQMRESDAAGNDFERNRAMLSLKMEL